MTLSTLAIAVVLVRRELVPASVAEGPSAVKMSAAQLNSLRNAATTVVDAPGSLEIIEFMDFECPFCKMFAQSIDSVRSEPESAITIRLLNYPIAGHPFARDAARVAECAGSVGKLDEFMRLAYRRQSVVSTGKISELVDSLDLSSSTSYVDCLRGDAVDGRIDRQMAVGQTIKVEGTPTIIIGGVRLTGTPTTQQLRAMARASRQGSDSLTAVIKSVWHFE